MNNNYDEDCYDLTNKNHKRKATRKTGSGNNRTALIQYQEEEKDHRRNYSIGRNQAELDLKNSFGDDFEDIGL